MRITLFYFLIALFSIQAASYAQSHIWTGNGGDVNWFNAANWSANSIPVSSNHVLIGNDFTVEIEDDIANANTIELQNTATLIVKNNLVFSIQLTIDDDATLDWRDGFISGGGLIENNGSISISQQDEKQLNNTALTNNNNVLISDIGQLRLNENTTINNTSTGTFEMIGTGSLTHQTGTPVFNNEGLVTKTSAGVPGASYMILEMNNHGIIENEAEQTFLFLSPQAALNNFETGRIQGSGVYDITAPFQNVGTISPGNNGIGTLDIVNNFNLSPDAKLEFDIAGTNSGEYDVIDITGFPELEGNIIVNLMYSPQLGDEFTIITANDINSCNFPTQITAVNGSTEFVFDVICNNTSVVLEVVEEIVLGISDITEDEIKFNILPNPVSNTFTINLNASEVNSIASEELSLSFYNILGQEVRSITNFSEVNITFQRENLQGGIYFVQLRTINQILATTRMIVE